MKEGVSEQEVEKLMKGGRKKVEGQECICTREEQTHMDRINSHTLISSEKTCGARHPTHTATSQVHQQKPSDENISGEPS